MAGWVKWSSGCAGSPPLRRLANQMGRVITSGPFAMTTKTDPHAAAIIEMRKSGYGRKKAMAMRKANAKLAGGKDEIAEYLRRREALAKQADQEAE